MHSPKHTPLTIGNNFTHENETTHMPFHVHIIHPSKVYVTNIMDLNPNLDFLHKYAKLATNNFSQLSTVLYITLKA